MNLVSMRGRGNGFIHCREGNLLFVLMVEIDLIYVSGQRNWLGVCVGASKFPSFWSGNHTSVAFCLRAEMTHS